MRYQKNFLSTVVVRFDYKTPVAFQDSTRPRISERIGEIYPKWTSKPTANISVSIGPSGSTLNQQLVGMIHEHRKGETPFPVVQLASEFLTIEYGSGNYSHFAPLRSDIEQIIAGFREFNADLKFSRIGIRYINEIGFPTGNATDWDGLINPDLINASLAAIPVDWKIARSIHQLQTFNDSGTLLLHYGFANPDFPNAFVRRHFVLDIDSFRADEIELHEAVECLSALNSICEETFERSIASGLREQMGIINE